MITILIRNCSHFPFIFSADHKNTMKTLDRCDPNIAHRVVSVSAPHYAPEWAIWLADIGFVPQANVVLLTRAALGGDPMIVRIASSTFALRRAEAHCVIVDQVAEPDPLVRSENH
jgi:ferrous iron transport protein A